MIANKRKFVSCLKGNLEYSSKKDHEEITIQKLESVSFILAFWLAKTKWTPSAVVGLPISKVCKKGMAISKD